jgi:uncharacterized protein (DUF1501 family)
MTTMPVKRRFFLKSGGIALVGVGSGLVSMPVFLARAVQETKRAGKVLVVLFQRGAADGLNIVVPHGEREYYRLRPSIAVPRPRRGAADAALDLDGRFGLHPALAPLETLYDAGMLAVINAAGSPHATRSHFDAQEFMESGTPGVRSTQDGWLNRYLQHHALAHASTLRSVSLTSQVPRTLAGPAPTLAIPALEKFGFGRHRARELVESGLADLYATSGDGLLAPTAGETFEALEQLERIDPSSYEPENGAVYPSGDLGRDLRQVAQLIKAGVGVEIAFAEIGGWDHHVNEGGAQGPLANLLRRFAGGLGAFVRDMGDRMGDVALVTMSEFGRTAAENGNRGTDHGHANAMMVLGGGVRGGIYGTWPGLEREQLHEGRDLARTTDYRDVLAAVLAGQLGATDLAPVFPGHRVALDRFAGLFASGTS